MRFNSEKYAQQIVHFYNYQLMQYLMRILHNYNITDIITDIITLVI